MPNKVTRVVVNGVAVIRYNGNNCTAGRDSADEGSYKEGEPKRSAKITAWRKAKAQRLYSLKYLGG